MNQNRMFSIIMASYNQEAFISQAIESVLNQTYQNFELIIVDGVSTDGTLKILDKFKKHKNIKIIIEPDNGLYHARNKAILLASGDILGFLNTDDFYEPNALRAIKNTFYNYPNTDIVYGSIDMVNKNGHFLKEYPNLVVNNEIDRVKKDLYLPDQATFIRRNNIEFTGLYDLHYKIASDWDFWQRCILIGLNFKMTPETIANFRQYAETLSFSDSYRRLRFVEKLRYHRKYNDCIFSRVVFNLYIINYLKDPLKKLLGINNFK